MNDTFKKGQTKLLRGKPNSLGDSLGEK